MIINIMGMEDLCNLMKVCNEVISLVKMFEEIVLM